MTSISFDPRTGAPFSTAEGCTPDAVDCAVRSAAGVAGHIANVQPAERRQWPYAVADGIKHHRREFVALTDGETAVGQRRLDPELTRMNGQLRSYGDTAAQGTFLGASIDHANGTAPSCSAVESPARAGGRLQREQFSFRYWRLGSDTGSALAAGCPVVVKAHPAHLELSRRL